MMNNKNEKNELREAKKLAVLWSALIGISIGVGLYGIVNKQFEFYYILPIIVCVISGWKPIKHYYSLKKNGSNK